MKLYSHWEAYPLVVFYAISQGLGAAALVGSTMTQGQFIGLCILAFVGVGAWFGYIEWDLRR